jgi:hypothetical protein
METMLIDLAKKLAEKKGTRKTTKANYEAEMWEKEEVVLRL